jgi:hypothetical protein
MNRAAGDGRRASLTYLLLLLVTACMGCGGRSGRAEDVFVEDPTTLAAVRALHAPPEVVVNVERVTHSRGGTGGSCHSAACLVLLPVLVVASLLPPEVTQHATVTTDGEPSYIATFDDGGAFLLGQVRDGDAWREVQALPLERLDRRPIVSTRRLRRGADGQELSSEPPPAAASSAARPSLRSRAGGRGRPREARGAVGGSAHVARSRSRCGGARTLAAACAARHRARARHGLVLLARAGRGHASRGGGASGPRPWRNRERARRAPLLPVRRCRGHRRGRSGPGAREAVLRRRRPLPGALRDLPAADARSGDKPLDRAPCAAVRGAAWRAPASGVGWTHRRCRPCDCGTRVPLRPGGTPAAGVGAALRAPAGACRRRGWRGARGTWALRRARSPWSLRAVRRCAATPSWGNCEGPNRRL